MCVELYLDKEKKKPFGIRNLNRVQIFFYTMAMHSFFFKLVESTSRKN